VLLLLAVLPAFVLILLLLGLTRPLTLTMARLMQHHQQQQQQQQRHCDAVSPAAWKQEST
jgi:hypothetical protein